MANSPPRLYQNALFFAPPWTRDHESIVLEHISNAIFEGRWMAGNLENNIICLGDIRRKIRQNLPGHSIRGISFEKFMENIASGVGVTILSLSLLRTPVWIMPSFTRIAPLLPSISCGRNYPKCVPRFCTTAREERGIEPPLRICFGLH